MDDSETGGGVKKDSDVRQFIKTSFVGTVVLLIMGSIILPAAVFGYSPDTSYFAAGIGVMGGVYFKWVKPRSCPWYVPVIFGLLTLLSLTVTQALTIFRIVGDGVWVLGSTLIILIELMVWYIIAEDVINDHTQIFVRAYDGLCYYAKRIFTRIK